MDKLRDLDFPRGTVWLFNHFYNIWKHCEVDMAGNRIFTPKQILDYCECYGVTLTYRERKTIMKIEEWAVESIAELRSKSDT